jgi:amino acid permease
MSAKKLISREEVLGGLGGRTTKQANTVLALIEQRTAHLVAQAQQVTDTALVASAAPSPRQAFLRALAEGRAALPPPPIQAIERFATHWAILVPENAEIRATLAHLLGQKYLLPANSTAGIATALGLTTPAVQQAYQRLYKQPISTIYTSQVTPLQRLRWLWATFSARLEGLPPFWLTFFLTMPAVSGLLALPIALAGVGPRWGVIFIVGFGLINMLTAGALAETVVRSGTARFGLGFLGQLAQEYLGAGATTLLTLALVISNFLVLIIFFLGVGGTLAGATGLPAPFWMLLLLAAVLYFLSRRSLNATVTTNLLIVFVNLLIVLVLLLLALPAFQLSNLTSNAAAPAFTPAAAGSIVGILSATFLSHFLVATYGPVILPRDPSGRAWQRGAMAAVATMTLIAVLWLLVLSGVLGPVTLSNAKGTVVTPLAQLVGPAVNVLGSLLVILSIGLATIQVSLAQYYSVEERLPPRGSATWVGKLGAWPRFALASSPMLLVLILAIWLLNSGISSFASLLGTVNVLALPLLTGIIPPLLLVATRRMGDFVPGFMLRWLGQPLLVGLLVLFFVATILIHGLYIWEAWPLRLLGIGGALAILIVALRTWRQATRADRVVITVRHDAQPQGQSQLSLVAQGQPLAATVSLATARGQTQQTCAETALIDFAKLRKITLQLPATLAPTLKLWLHDLSIEGLSSGLPAQVTLAKPGQPPHINGTTTPEQGILTLPLSGEACQVDIVLAQAK